MSHSVVGTLESRLRSSRGMACLKLDVDHGRQPNEIADHSAIKQYHAFTKPHVSSSVDYNRKYPNLRADPQSWMLTGRRNDRTI